MAISVQGDFSLDRESLEMPDQYLLANLLLDAYSDVHHMQRPH